MVNNVVLVGRITRDPEIRQINGNNSSVCNFTLAVNRNFKNGQGEYDADFVNCVVFNQVANLMERYVTKGQLLSVQGRIQTRNFDGNDGKRVYVTEVVANNVSFLESRREGGSQGGGNFNQAPQTPVDNYSIPQNDTFESSDIDMNIDDDDLPF